MKVIARIEPGWALRSEISQAIRRVSTRVLPEPAPATTSSGAPGVHDRRPLRLVEPLEQLVGGSGPRRVVRGSSAGATCSRPGSGVGVLMSPQPYGAAGPPGDLGVLGA